MDTIECVCVCVCVCVDLLANALQGAKLRNSRIVEYVQKLSVCLALFFLSILKNQCFNTFTM
jgi:hypothetical protein